MSRSSLNFAKPGFPSYYHALMHSQSRRRLASKAHNLNDTVETLAILPGVCLATTGRMSIAFENLMFVSQ